MVMSAVGLSASLAGMALTAGVSASAVSTPHGVPAPGQSRSFDTGAGARIGPERGPAGDETSVSATDVRGAVHPRRVLVLDCFTGRFKPSSITLACGDGNARVERLVWAGWGASSAQGHGIYVVNTCVPSCVQGHFVSYKVDIRLSRPVLAANGTRYLTRIGLTFRGRGPTGSHTLQLDNCWAVPPSSSYPKCPANKRGAP